MTSNPLVFKSISFMRSHRQRIIHSNLGLPGTESVHTTGHLVVLAVLMLSSFDPDFVSCGDVNPRMPFWSAVGYRANLSGNRMWSSLYILAPLWKKTDSHRSPHWANARLELVTSKSTISWYTRSKSTKKSSLALVLQARPILRALLILPVLL